MSDARESARDELVRQLVDSGLPQREAEVTADALLGLPLAAGQTITGLYPEHLADLVRRAFQEQNLESSTLKIQRGEGSKLELVVISTGLAMDT